MNQKSLNQGWHNSGLGESLLEKLVSLEKTLKSTRYFPKIPLRRSKTKHSNSEDGSWSFCLEKIFKSIESFDWSAEKSNIFVRKRCTRKIGRFRCQYTVSNTVPIIEKSIRSDLNFVNFVTPELQPVLWVDSADQQTPCAAHSGTHKLGLVS